MNAFKENEILFFVFCFLNRCHGSTWSCFSIHPSNVMMCFMLRNYCHSSCVAKISLAFPYHITFFGVIV